MVDQVLTLCAGEANPAVGGDGGDPSTPKKCPAGSVAKGLHGGQGDSLDSVGLICAPSDKLDSDQFTKLEIIGGPGGTAYERFCPPRTAVIGITGATNPQGTFLDTIHPVCRKIPVAVE